MVSWLERCCTAMFLQEPRRDKPTIQENQESSAATTYLWRLWLYCGDENCPQTDRIIKNCLCCSRRLQDHILPFNPHKLFYNHTHTQDENNSNRMLSRLVITCSSFSNINICCFVIWNWISFECPGITSNAIASPAFRALRRGCRTPAEGYLVDILAGLIHWWGRFWSKMTWKKTSE